jgi:hypothetical protein
LLDAKKRAIGAKFNIARGAADPPALRMFSLVSFTQKHDK